MTQTKPNTACTTGVNPVRTHGFGVWGNARVVMSVRVDGELKKRFKQAAKAKFGSTCNPIECFMAGVVGSYERDLQLGVNPSNTVSIGTIIIQRNLRERRKLVVERDVEVALTKEQFEEKTQLEKMDRKFEMVFDQWAEHVDEKWRQHWFSEAEKYPELESAKALLTLRKTE